MSNFQISYIFQFIDKYSKVAADLHKKVGEIDKKILGSAKNFQKLGKQGTESFSRINKISRRSEEQMKSFTLKTKKQTLAMKSMGAVVGNLKFRIASLIVTMGMTGFGMSQLIDKASKIEKSFTVMSALTGITGKDFDFLEKKAFDFARTMGVSMEDVATGFKRVAGLKPELLEDVEALAELTKWTLILDAPMEQIEKISRALTVALNVYGRSAKSAAEFANLLAAAQRKGSAEVINMALSFMRAGPVAETAGVPFRELIATLQGLARAGVLSQMAGTSMRAILIRVARVAKGTGKTFAEAMKEIAKEVLSTTDDLGRLSRAEQIFGMRQSHAAVTVMRAIPFIEEFQEKIKDTNIALETAEKVLTLYERRVRSIWAVWDQEVKQTFKEMEPSLLKLHTQWVTFLKQLSMGVPGGLSALVNVISELLADLLQVVNAFLLLWNVIKAPFDLLIAFGRFLETWEKIDLTTAWRDLRKEVAGVGENLKLAAMGTFPEVFGGPPELRDIVGPEEIAGKPGAAGRVQVDVNLKGNTEAAESVRTTVEGDVDFNMGRNFAYSR